MATLTVLAKHPKVAIIPLMAGIALLIQLDFGFHNGLVATVAIELFVRTRKRVFTLLVVIKKPLLPIIGVVTQLTVQTQSFLVRSLVVLEMAISAFRLRHLERPGQMALLTRRYCMSTKQREYRQVMIKENFCIPPAFVVALLAFLTLFALMHVVILMARYTVQLKFGVNVAAVTRDTRDIFMAALEFKFSVFRVVKDIPRPRLWHMAALTLLAKKTTVRVFRFMAGNAGGIDLLVYVTFMASKTGNLCVLSL